jgi:hypothetical protein
MIIRFYKFLGNVHVLERALRCKVFPHFLLERTIKPFDNGCLGLVLRREKTDVLFLQKGLKLSIQKLHPFVCVKRFRLLTLFKYFLKGFNKFSQVFVFIGSAHTYLLSTSITVKMYLKPLLYFLIESVITRSASHCSSIAPSMTRFRLKRYLTGLCKVYVSCFYINTRILFRDI